MPLVSFVARQRDLKDFLGGGAVGAEQVALGRLLPVVGGPLRQASPCQPPTCPRSCSGACCTPTSDAGRRRWTGAVARVRANPAAWRLPAHDEAGSSGVDFAQVYPFSPALVDAMIALSSLMQRERTALKIMSELLADGRDELTVGDVIPVGDLFDVVVLGDAKPLTEDMKRLFEPPRPSTPRRCGPTCSTGTGSPSRRRRGLARSHPFRREDRLAKTLLVAAIAPGAASLKDLTASKLAALNFGSVVSMRARQEATQVARAGSSEWSEEFGEITVGAGRATRSSRSSSPGSTTTPCSTHVQTEDTHGQPARPAPASCSLEEIEAEHTGASAATYTLHHVWRGQQAGGRRRLRQHPRPERLPTEALQAAPGRWKLVVDFPFDD